MIEKRGRPTGSRVRANLIEILHFKGNAYGYDIYKDYCELFPKVTLRLIYYHLRKGLALGEFSLEHVKVEKGEYSWGGEAEKKYYKLGQNANPRADKKVRAYFERVKKD